MLTTRVACAKGNVKRRAIVNNVPGPGPWRRASGADELPPISSLYGTVVFPNPMFFDKSQSPESVSLDSFSTPPCHAEPGRTNFIIIAFQNINISAQQKRVNNSYYLFYTAGMALANNDV